MEKECFMDVLRTAINSGRSQMKSEALAKVWSLLEQAALKKDEPLLKTLYWVHGQIQALPSRIEDKPKAMLEEIENDK